MARGKDRKNGRAIRYRGERWKLWQSSHMLTGGGVGLGGLAVLIQFRVHWRDGGLLLMRRQGFGWNTDSPLVELIMTAMTKFCASMWHLRRHIHFSAKLFLLSRGTPLSIDSSLLITSRDSAWEVIVLEMIFRSCLAMFDVWEQMRVKIKDNYSTSCICYSCSGEWEKNIY